MGREKKKIIHVPMTKLYSVGRIFSAFTDFLSHWMFTVHFVHHFNVVHHRCAFFFPPQKTIKPVDKNSMHTKNGFLFGVSLVQLCKKERKREDEIIASNGI